MDPEAQVTSWFGVSGTPTNFLIDRSGNVLGGGPGYRDWATPEAHQLIQSLLVQDDKPPLETAPLTPPKPNADPTNIAQVAAGQTIYAQHCASCHGMNLEGQPNWKQPLPTGRLPAPPHDETGHTWHHPDHLLFKVTKFGRDPATGTSPGSDMPAFQNVLSDADIWAVLSFIKSRWPEHIRAQQASINARAQ